MIDRDLRIVGDEGPFNTFIDGNGGVVIRHSGVRSKLTLEGLSIMNGDVGVVSHGVKDLYVDVLKCHLDRNGTGLQGWGRLGTTITNSLVTENDYGVQLTYYVYDSSITNTTFSGNDVDVSFSPSWDNPSELNITNSIIRGQIDGHEDNDPVYLNYCNYDPSKLGTNVVVQDGNQTENPLFSDTTNHIYELDPLSPCIDVGTEVSGVVDDIVGVDRPQGDYNDIGAFEYVDTDGDGTTDGFDECVSDPNKVEPGVCGCGVVESDTDTDGDGTPDCNDGCVDDPNKTEVGVCGCGVSDTDTDGDGTPDCNDGCVDDPNKTEVGVCGCGVSDTDTDGDGTPDCNDSCVDDPNKTEVGVCGCGVSDADTDGDGTPDCNDQFPDDPSETTDTDGDGIGNNSDDDPDDATVCRVESETGSGNIEIDVSSNSGKRLSDVSVLSVDEVDQTNRPSDYEFPDGLVKFSIKDLTLGETVEIKITVPGTYSGQTRYFKVSDEGFSEFTGAVIDGNTVTLTITDGGDGDHDGTVNGMIDDPGGLGERETTTTTTTTTTVPPTNSDGGGGGGGGCFVSVVGNPQPR